MWKFILNKLFWGVLRHVLPDRPYIYVRYWMEHGFLPDLEHPKRLSEKIHWLKLHDRTELRQLVAHRINVRDYVAQKAGEKYLIPLIGCYDSLTNEVWNSLPQRFVLKASHGSAMARLVYNKEEENADEVIRQTQKWLNTDYVKIGREWVYKGIKRQIIAEELITGRNGRAATDYKFFCFHGEVKFFHVDLDRFGDGRRNFFDRNLNPIKARFRLPAKEGEVQLPDQIKKAIELAEKLSADFNFIRADLYLADDTIYFGELTNFPGNGFHRLEPDTFDLKAGSYLQLQ